MFKVIKKCRICGNDKLRKIIDLGNQPPANSLKKKKIVLKKVPLVILRCPKCFVLQLNATVSPKYLFSKYLWVTGTSNAIKKFRKIFVKKIINKNKNKKQKLLEIASNDGFFLSEFKKNNFEILGIDPAKNIAKKANSKGLKTLPVFFNEKTAKKIKKIFKPNIIVCRNVIPHVENLNSLLKGINYMLDGEGKAYIEFHYAEELSKNLNYDSIYHEHIFYFTYIALKNALIQNKLYPIDYFESPISGGAIVLEISKNKFIKESIKIKDLEKYEKKIKINKLQYWLDFNKKCINHKKKLKLIISKMQGKIYAFGASARSSTLLNFCKISNNTITNIFDNNPLKQNLYTAGTNIKIIKPNIELIKKINNIVVLAWNFEKEIINYLKNKIRFKGLIVVVLPKIKKIICK